MEAKNIEIFSLVFTKIFEKLCASAGSKTTLIHFSPIYVHSKCFLVASLYG
jgi:hypothetical protein